MTTRFYSSVAQQTTLSGTINASTTTVIVASTTGFPSSFPYVLALDYGSSSNELIDVNSAAGTTLTVTRAVDGTSGQSHSSGAVVRHVSSGRDFKDSRDHENASNSVHGLSGTVVGTTDSQSLSNKTLVSPTLSGTVAAGTSTISGAPTFTGAVIFNGVPIINAGSTFSRVGSGTPAISVKVTGDAGDRLEALASGQLLWGDGTAAGDTNLYRSAANILFTDDAFTATGAVTGLAGGTFSGSSVLFTRGTTTNPAVRTQVTGDTQDRILIEAQGRLMWGSGSATADTNLYRNAADVLKTDDAFVALIETTTSLTPATNFTTTTMAGRRTCGIATISISLGYTGGTITSDATGNIADTLACTLPAGWRPANSLVTAFDKSGVAGGTLTILSDGTCTLKTLDPTAAIASGTSVNFSLTFVL